MKVKNNSSTQNIHNYNDHFVYTSLTVSIIMLLAVIYIEFFSNLILFPATLWVVAVLQPLMIIKLPNIISAFFVPTTSNLDKLLNVKSSNKKQIKNKEKVLLVIIKNMEKFGLTQYLTIITLFSGISKYISKSNIDFTLSVFTFFLTTSVYYICKVRFTVFCRLYLLDDE